MGVKLVKGQNISLEKEAPGITKAMMGLGWDAKSGDGEAFDLDAVAFMLGADGKVINDNAFVFYGNLKSLCESVVSSGDNRTGAGDGDDEVININIATLPAEVEKIIIAVNIHGSDNNGYNFGQVANSVVRLVNPDTNEEVAKYELDEDYSTEKAMIFGELYKRNDEWKFKAIGEGFTGGLKEMCNSYGVNVD